MLEVCEANPSVRLPGPQNTTHPALPHPSHKTSSEPEEGIGNGRDWSDASHRLWQRFRDSSRYVAPQLAFIPV